MAELSDEHFGIFLLSWVWVYLIPAAFFYLGDLRRGAPAVVAYVASLPAFWHSVLLWCVDSEGRRAWLTAREAVDREEKAFQRQLTDSAKEAAAKQNIPPEHHAARRELQRSLLATARAKAARPESYRLAEGLLKTKELRIPSAHKSAGLALHLFQRTFVIAARVALLGWIHGAYLYDPWGIVGIAQGASDKQVERAFRQKSLTMHPDKGGDEKAFLALQEAKDIILKRIARESDPIGVHYALPKSMNNIYAASAMLMAIVLFPITCICGAAALSVTYPLLYTGCHVFLLWNLLCRQIGFSTQSVLLSWTCWHVLCVLPALLVMPRSSRLFSLTGAWSLVGPGGFLSSDWTCTRIGGPDVDQPMKAGTASTCKDTTPHAAPTPGPLAQERSAAPVPTKRKGWSSGRRGQ